MTTSAIAIAGVPAVLHACAGGVFEVDVVFDAVPVGSDGAGIRAGH